ncbi:MAG: hypothetical protein OXU86_06165 [Thaumarchaeota archaeon]|nr:hypothetical protein [Nitrososphaerota archaeon]MDD9843178.1 hypothetical protein [Nitrososphaerota archaeon]
MSVDVVCGKCGKRIHTMKMLKSVKDVMSTYGNRCPACGQALSATEFSVEAKETGE